MKSGFVELPKQTHSGVLRFGDVEIECAVLEGGQRVVIDNSMAALVGERRGVSGKEGVFGLPDNIKPFASNDLSVSGKPVVFRSSKTNRAERGYDASIIPKLAVAYRKAQKSGTLHHKQAAIADRCDAVLMALAEVGIVALVDEATGYQKERPDDDLQGLLAREIQRWQKTFEDEFYDQLKRLYGWPRTYRACGRFVNDFVYARLAPGVLDSLARRNPAGPDGQRAHRHHQLLSLELGHPMLKAMIEGVMVVMATSQDRTHFEKRMDMFYPKRGESQGLLPVEGGRFSPA